MLFKSAVLNWVSDTKLGVKAAVSGKQKQSVSYFEKSMQLYCLNNDFSHVQLKIKV